MLAIYIVTAILNSAHVQAAMDLWAWFGSHIFLTILMLIFLA